MLDHSGLVNPLISLTPDLQRCLHDPSYMFPEGLKGADHYAGVRSADRAEYSALVVKNTALVEGPSPKNCWGGWGQRFYAQQTRQCEAATDLARSRPLAQSQTSSDAPRPPHSRGDDQRARTEAYIGLQT